MSDNPIDDLNNMRRGDKALRKAVEIEVDLARHLAGFIEKFGEDGLRESLGDDFDFDRIKGLVPRLEELGEDELKLVLFRERKAEAGFAPDQN
jgi:hypothetical protein